VRTKWRRTVSSPAGLVTGLGIACAAAALAAGRGLPTVLRALDEALDVDLDTGFDGPEPTLGWMPSSTLRPRVGSAPAVSADWGP
jgi:hypothetical protein